MRAHRLAEDVRLGGGVAAHLDGDLHHLLLVEDHAERVLKDGLEARVRVGDRLLPRAPAQVGVDRVALDRAGADDRHLDDEVLEALGAGLGERLHLRAALDLEHADRVRRADGAEDLGVVVGECVEVDPLSRVALDPVEALGHHAQGAQGEEVDLHQPQRLDVLLVELRDDSSRHGGTLDRDEVDQRGAGDEHPADVDPQVTREAVDLRAQLQEPLPAVAGRGVRSGWCGRSGRCRRRFLRRFLPYRAWVDR